MVDPIVCADSHVTAVADSSTSRIAAGGVKRIGALLICALVATTAIPRFSAAGDAHNGGKTAADEERGGMGADAESGGTAADAGSGGACTGTDCGNDQCCNDPGFPVCSTGAPGCCQAGFSIFCAGTSTCCAAGTVCTQCSDGIHCTQDSQCPLPCTGTDCGGGKCCSDPNFSICAPSGGCCETGFPVDCGAGTNTCCPAATTCTQCADGIHCTHDGQCPEGCHGGSLQCPDGHCAPVGRTCSGDCVGDFDGDDHVSINELLTLIFVALDTSDLGSCSKCDGNQDGRITINEILDAVGNALFGCSP